MVDGRGRILRAGLLLPLLTGVLAMHVLLLCSDGAGEGGHGGHVGHAPAAVPAAPAMAAPAMTAHAPTSAAADVGAVGTMLVSAARGGAVADRSATTAVVCLAVLGAVVALVLRRRGGLAPRSTSTTVDHTRVRRRLARAPPSVPLPLLLCVSRT